MDYMTALAGTNNQQPEGGISAFDAAEAAPEFTPLPPGVYKARILHGEYTTTKAGADAYRIRFEVAEGPHKGQTVIRTWTFGTRALPYTKRDLAKLGLTTSKQLLSPFPEPGRDYIVCLVVAMRRDDNGTEWNDVKRVDLIRVETAPAAAFILPPKPPEGASKQTPKGLLDHTVAGSRARDQDADSSYAGPYIEGY